jgi:hypothetical protein
VDTRELSSKTMESKKQQGLYFIGEVVDVTGWLGGLIFNGRGRQVCGRAVCLTVNAFGLKDQKKAIVIKEWLSSVDKGN